MSSMHSFEELACYQSAHIFRKNVSRFCRTLPKPEEYRLKDQAIRASRSVTANIAEGFGRHHHQENIQYCRQARGSLLETLDHLNVALDEEYLTDVAYQELRSQLEDTWRILNAYIVYLETCVKN